MLQYRKVFLPFFTFFIKITNHIFRIFPKVRTINRCNLWKEVYIFHICTNTISRLFSSVTICSLCSDWYSLIFSSMILIVSLRSASTSLSTAIICDLCCLISWSVFYVYQRRKIIWSAIVDAISVSLFPISLSKIASFFKDISCIIGSINQSTAMMCGFFFNWSASW